MRAKLIQIGNSRGIRLPKAFIAQVQLGDEVEIECGRGQIVLTAAKSPRAGWDEAFADALRKNGRERNEPMLDLPNQFDKTDWKW
jgi:antitoxin MazE